MYRCCQCNKPWAKIDNADLAHCARRVGLEDMSRMRHSLSSADKSRKALETPRTRSNGRIDEAVTDSTEDEAGASMFVGIKNLAVSTWDMSATGDFPISNSSTVNVRGLRSSSGRDPK